MASLYNTHLVQFALEEFRHHMCDIVHVSWSPQLVIRDGDLSPLLVRICWQQQLQQGSHGALAKVLHGAIQHGNSKDNVGWGKRRKRKINNPVLL